jgi:hypothetical protein
VSRKCSAGSDTTEVGPPQDLGLPPVLPGVATPDMRTRAQPRERSRVAQEADVSVEIVDKTLGGKPGLVRAIWERALAGGGPISAYRRFDAMRLHETDPRAVIRQWGTSTSEGAPRVAPILLLIRATAAIDPDMAALRELSHIEDS